MAKRPNLKRLEWRKVPTLQLEIANRTADNPRGVRHYSLAYEWKRLPYARPTKARKGPPTPIPPPPNYEPYQNLTLDNYFNPRYDPFRLRVARLRTKQAFLRERR